MSESDEFRFPGEERPLARELGALERVARSDGSKEPLPLREWVALAEAWRIAQALREARGNRSEAARALGIGRRTLYSKLAKLGLEPSWSLRGRPGGFPRPASAETDRSA
jgi:DNA-binding NtrC family response regulator